MSERDLPGTVPVQTDPELPTVQDQLIVFARELGELYRLERSRNAELEMVLESLQDTYLATMKSLAMVIEAKDQTTRGHLDRTQVFGLALARRVDPELAGSPTLGYGFFLHDIGKVGIPEHILCKAGPLTIDEWTVMRNHPIIGAQIVAPITFLSDTVKLIRHHHEWFDGTGYPDGLASEAIPLSARVFAVADSFDAMTSDRPYRGSIGPKPPSPSSERAPGPSSTRDRSRLRRYGNGSAEDDEVSARPQARQLTHRTADRARLARLRGVSTAAPLVRVVRSGLVESVHLGHAVVCDPRGRVLAALGDPDRLVFSRSSMKPLQAAVSLRRIAEPLPDELVAIMCASHNGEPVHVRVVRRLLRAGGLSERDLGCPPTCRWSPRRVGRPRPPTDHPNCSGSTPMLLACERSGASSRLSRTPPRSSARSCARCVGHRRRTTVVGRRVRRPGHGLPLRAMATLFARLARPSGSVDSANAPPGRRRHAVGPLPRRGARAFGHAADGRVPASWQVGAEGLHCAAVLTRDRVAVRIDDGSDRAAAPAWSGRSTCSAS